MAKKPVIRFNDFSDAWEEIELNEVAERITRKNSNLESTLPLTISAQYGLVDQRDFFNAQIVGKDVSGYYLLKKGEFAYNKSYSSEYPFGTIKRLDKYEMGVLSTLYILFSHKNINSDFLLHYYDSSYWHNEITKIAAEGARNHGLLNIAPEDFFNTKLKITRNENEQKDIGLFFTQISLLIASTQEKLEKAIILKKSMLEKMFPKDKEKIPELRFKGFSGEWEEQKLGSFVIDYIEKNCSELNYPVLTSSRQGIERQEEHFGKIQNHDTTDYNIIPAGYCAYRSRSDDFTFTFNINKLGYTGIISKYYPVFTFNNCNSYFITEYLNNNDTIKKQITYVATGTGQKVLSHDDFKNFNILIPDLKEQEMIGSFFESIDKLITSYNDELIKLKTIKKSLLEKMFV